VCANLRGAEGRSDRLSQSKERGSMLSAGGEACGTADTVVIRVDCSGRQLDLDLCAYFRRTRAEIESKHLEPLSW